MTAKKPALAPSPKIEPRAKRTHQLVDKKKQPITIYDAVSVAQLFAEPPKAMAREISRSVYVYPYGQTGAIYRYRIDEELLASKPAKLAPLAFTDAMNDHLENEDSYRPCHTLSSDGLEVHCLRYGKKMKGVELLALDSITLEQLRPPVSIASRDQIGMEGLPIFPAGPGRALVRLSVERRKGGLHMIDVKSGAVLASIESPRHVRAWHVAGGSSPFIVTATENKARVFSLGAKSFDEVATFTTASEIAMIDAGPSSEPGTFTVHALVEDTKRALLAVKRYVIRPDAEENKRAECVGDFFAEDIMFATHFPQPICATFDGRLLAVVGGNFAQSGLWEWFGPGLLTEESIVEVPAGSDGRLFRAMPGNGATLTEEGAILLAPVRAKR